MFDAEVGKRYWERYYYEYPGIINLLVIHTL